MNKEQMLNPEVFEKPGWNMTNDLIFKAVFGRDDEKSNCLLTELINAVFNLKGEGRITAVRIMNPFNLQNFIDDKISILDIKAETNEGELLNIEMQVGHQDFYVERSLYYWSKLYSEQLKRKDQYMSLKRTIGIHFLNDIHSKRLPYGHSICKLIDKRHGVEVTDILEIHYIQMALVSDIIKEREHILAEWVELMSDINNPERQEGILSLIKEKDVMKMAYEEYKSIVSNDKIRERLEAEEKYRLDHNSLMHQARVEGKEEGREEELVLIVRHMHSIGKSASEIAALTGHAEVVIEELLN